MKSKGKKRLSRALAIFTTVFMLMGMMPQAAFADEVPADDSIIQQEQQLDDEAQNIDDPVEEQQPQQQQSEPDMSNVPAVASEEPSQEPASGTVYMSVSYDGQYINDKNGGYIAYVPVPLSEVSSIDLDTYGLSEYWYDADEDGTNEITALQLIIYAHENLYGGDWSEVDFTGSPGSSYFQGGVFGFDENLNYYLNGEYPLASAGWGATSDQIVLEDGDYIDMASFSSWSFYGDSNYGFHFFDDGSGNFTHDYSAEAGKETSVKLVRSYSGMGSGATVYDEPGYTVSYGTSLYDVTGTVTTDDSGCADITFPSAGTWYVWADGGYGMEYPTDIVSSPAYAVATVNEAENPDKEKADEVIAKINGIGDNITLDSETAIVEARAAYDALTNAQKALITDTYLAKLATAEAALAALKTPLITGFVYISVSYDGRYVGAENGEGAPMAYVPVSFSEVSSVDLDEYELSDYKYDEDGDGAYEITALHLIIYAHENLYGGDWSDVTFTGAPGSSYFAGGVFGFDENLNYYLNGEYPLASAGWGATSDQIVLEAGDYIDMASFSSWDFYADSNYGFHFFADENGTFTHDYTVEAGTELPIKLVRSYSSMGSGASVFDEADYEIYYGENLYREETSVTTDENGCADIKFDSAGTWYLWCDGGYGLEYPDSIVSAPAYAKVTVTAAEEPAPESEAVKEVESKIKAIGEVNLDSEAVIKEAREAYEKLTDEQKALVENYSVLEAAESTLAGLKSAAAADKAAAEAVDALITAIGEVNIYSGEKIEAAREAYDALLGSAKVFVEKLSVLETAEAAIAEMYEAASAADHEAIYEATGNYLTELGTPSVGSTGGEWMVIDITRAGGECPEGYYENVVKYVKENINDKEQLHRSKSTDNSRVILGLTSAGYDVTDVAGHNLLEGITDMSYLKKQGINGPIWALIAFDSHNYEIPAGGDVTREALLETIVDAQHDDGGWALSVNPTYPSDPDMTGMALQALAPYYNTNKEVKDAVDKALDYLSETQSSSGGFGSIDGKCTESCAQVIVALTALGIDPEKDDRFIKNGMSVVDAMCTFAVNGGGFAHVPNGTLNGMATEQGQYALAAYYRMLDGKTSLYDMSDVTIVKNNPDTGVSGENGTGDAGSSIDKNQQSSSDKTTTKSITKSASIKLSDNTPTEEQLAQGKENHYDKATGVDARDNFNDILPWYVKLVVEPKDMTDDQQAAVKSALRDEGELFAINDIYFINTQDDTRWSPEKPIKIKLPMVDIGDYEHAVIVHITDDGKIEFIKGTIDGDMIAFEADSFSLYGIAGSNVSINDLLGAEDNDPVIWPWIVIAIIALAAIAYLAYRRKREA